MDNLLTRYGITVDPKRKYSISFVDDFMDCSYRSFLNRFAKIQRDESVNLPTTFGSGCHRGLARINRSMKEGREVCQKCEFECKVTSHRKSEAMNRTPEECEVQRIMNEEFECEFDKDTINGAMEEFTRKGQKDKGQVIIDKLLRLGPQCMKSALFERQPLGEILAVEERVNGTLGEFGLVGILDLVLGIKGKSLILDYKTSAQKPSLKKFPLRQLSLYIHMLEGLGLPVNGVSALYMVKTEAPKKARKNSAPHQQTYLNFFSLDKNRGLYTHVVNHVENDMKAIQECVGKGIFMRNRNSMYCPCEFSKYCESTEKLDKYMSENPA